MKRLLLILFLLAGTAQAETFGNLAEGASATVPISYQFNAIYEYNEIPGPGTVTAAKVKCRTYTDAYDSLIVILYKKEAVLADCDSVASTGWVDVNQPAAGWVTLPFTATLEADQVYTIGLIGVTSLANNLRVYSNFIADSGYVRRQLDQYYPPADLSGTADNHKNYWSVHIVYTPTGGAVKRHPATIDDWVPEGAYIK